MAKARKGSRKPASRAKKTAVKRTTKRSGSRSTTMGRKQLAPYGLDLKKLQDDIFKAQAALEKRLAGANSQNAEKLRATQEKLGQWTQDITSICGTSGEDEPCGTAMVIS